MGMPRVEAFGWPAYVILWGFGVVALVVPPILLATIAAAMGAPWLTAYGIVQAAWAIVFARWLTGQ
ncbi:hypothetical protein FHP25_25065 [Vineibacter terrae]|uniref:Uncharacterized protein n=1 Tax=Vineibacter terrae TaxID=2586908 RepID=A0A5C8PGU4_9HYPH|nr:hypothetical protein [Vineibacter terrae]TXL72570.1 hypothetical protein FHP25_25065 [Vineibacter terrae]